MFSTLHIFNTTNKKAPVLRQGLFPLIGSLRGWPTSGVLLSHGGQSRLETSIARLVIDAELGKAKWRHRHGRRQMAAGRCDR